MNMYLMFLRKRKSSPKGHSSTGESGQSVPKPGDDTYAALNPMNTSPDYDTLQNVKDSASDTYTTLNAATMSSDYDTLRGVAPRLSEEKYSRPGE
ncbi:hypothetical protein AMELA_G00000740 [Ameiurus melas]|uniref:Uncharacterized protein n=1 Tax=Ameiurus melas TaxID=219545 RepID=A0A7J6BDX9_AMEME|nr:hypothetical protein AMELA_G00000740 [Ameiurus melas]